MIIGGSEILDMIVIEIAYGERINQGAGIKDQRRREGPISVSQQHRDAAGYVGRYQVLTAVTVEIADGERSLGRGARRMRNPSIKRQWRLECPVSISQQHRHRPTGAGDNRKVL